MDFNPPDTVPYKIDPAIYRRFDERQNIFGRLVHDTNAPFYRKSMYVNAECVLAGDRHGYSRIEFARALASWTVYDYFYGAFSGEKLTQANSVMEKPRLDPFNMKDPEHMKAEMKQTAQAFGADLVGITQRDERWIYSHDLNGGRIKIPDPFQTVIVMAIAMNTDAIKKSPAFAASFATGIGYSRMALCISCLAEFIRYLGYEAVPMGNDTALSIPLAIDAGLGELGRNGLLITPRFGPCVRICKVYTTLPLIPDRPITSGVQEFCRNCTKCADACKADAIQKKTEPSFETASPSNNRGICRWAVNHDRCYGFWIENAGDCSNCIAACPFFIKEHEGH